MSLQSLFEKYSLTQFQIEAFHAAKKYKNLPSIFSQDIISDEEYIRAIIIATVDFPENNPHDNDIKFYKNKIEERIRNLEKAESTYKYFSLQWTPPLMKQLIINWSCGMLCIDPDLTTVEGNPIQWVREYYGPESNYPNPDQQTEAWKQSVIDLYVLMARSIAKTYPNSISKGIVSMSDMQNFDWIKYDMGTKQRNYGITNVIPNRLKYMLVFNPDDKSRKFYEEMTPRMRKKWGFRQYETLNDLLEKEGVLVGGKDKIPTFLGGNYRLDVLKCLQTLFSYEPEVLDLLNNTYAEMQGKGEIPVPKHML